MGRPVAALGAVALAELVVNRLAVPALRPEARRGVDAIAVPAWHEALDYVGLFLFYLTAVLALVVLAGCVVRAWRSLPSRWPARLGRGLFAAGASALIAIGAASLFGVTPGATTSAIAVVATAVASVALLTPAASPRGALGVAIGGALLVAPLAIHAWAVLGALLWWPPETLDARAAGAAETVAMAMVLAAIASPYTLGPRPLGRAMVRLPPLVVGMLVASGSLLLVRYHYAVVVELAQRGAGVELTLGRPDRGLPLFVMAIATLAWMLASCAMAPSGARRRVGLGVLLVVLGGGSLAWPGHLALILVGLAIVVDAASTVRAEEEAALAPVLPPTPPIDDAVWHAYVQQVVAGLRGRGHGAQALTARAHDGQAATIIAASIAGRDAQLRIERAEGRVSVIDLRFGRDLGGADAPPGFAVVSRRAGAHPEPPDAGAVLRTDGAATGLRWRGDAALVQAIVDDDARAQLDDALEGWLAVWEGQSVRWRVHPGRGASIDRPIPVADLAERGAAPDGGTRLVAWLEGIAALAARTLPPSEPA